MTTTSTTEPQVTESEQPSIKRVMGIFAHPDDPEFFAGASFARWAAEGAELIFVLATSGDKGSADLEMTSDRLIEIRELEERAAAAALGVREVIFLRYRDGELVPSLELRRDLVRILRMRKPDIVVTCDPMTMYWPGGGINHPDHRAIGEAVIDSVYPTARDRLNFPELERDEMLEVHKVKQVYLAGTRDPNTRVDVSSYIDQKIASLRNHISQIADMDAMALRVKERSIDPHSPVDQVRYIEQFCVLNLA
jgi:LmbE family N-acetylglucosaminyl deacetylase